MEKTRIDGSSDDDSLVKDETNRLDDTNGYVIYGLEGNDLLEGSSGDDLLDGGNGNEDVLVGDPGNDTLDGGDGTLDAVTYSKEVNDINIDLIAGTATGVDIGNDTLLNIEVADAGKGNDTLVGSDVTYILRGLEGNDTITAGKGGGIAYGGHGDDLLYGGLNPDIIYGNSGNDSITGGESNDVLFGGEGNDTLDGGAGNDNIAAYELSFMGIKANLEKGTVIGGSSGIDTLLNIQSIDATSHNDRLIGNGENNVLQAFEGLDILKGGAGNDTLIGGAGRDVINTGKGADTVVLDSLKGFDKIVDFSVKKDTIQLNHDLQDAIFTSLSVGKLAKDMFISGTDVTEAADSNDYLIYNKTTGALFYDADGNGAGDSIQIATIGNHAALTFADFIVV